MKTTRKNSPQRLQLFLIFALTLPAEETWRIEILAGNQDSGDGQPAGLAVLRSASAVAVDRDGRVFFSDLNGAKIRALAPTGIISTIAGVGPLAVNVNDDWAITTSLSRVNSITIDRLGRLLCVDAGAKVVRRVGRDGTMEIVAGGGRAAAGPTNDGSNATDVYFEDPVSILTDPTGGFYVADKLAGRVYYVSADGILTTFAGTQLAGSQNDNVPPYSSSLNKPTALAIHPLGGIVIVEQGAGRIRRVFANNISAIYNAPAGEALGSLLGATYDNAGSIVIAFERSLTFLSPRGQVAIDIAPTSLCAHPAGGVLISTEQNLVHVLANGTISYIAGTTSEPTDAPTNALDLVFKKPSSVTRDGSGNLYVADAGSNRVWKLESNGRATLVAGNGTRGFCGDGGLAVMACLSGPMGVAVDSLGTLVIADTGNHSIRAVTQKGTIYTIVGNGRPGLTSAAGTAAGTLLNRPRSVAVGPMNEIFIADSGNGRVISIGTGGLVSTIYPGGLGTEIPETYQPTSISASISGHLGIASDTSGTILISPPARSGFMSIFAGSSGVTAISLARDNSVVIASDNKGIPSVRIVTTDSAGYSLSSFRTVPPALKNFGQISSIVRADDQSLTVASLEFPLIVELRAESK